MCCTMTCYFFTDMEYLWYQYVDVIEVMLQGRMYKIGDYVIRDLLIIKYFIGIMVLFVNESLYLS